MLYVVILLCELVLQGIPWALRISGCADAGGKVG